MTLSQRRKRERNKIELRNQLFVIFDKQEGYLYINDVNKKGFVKAYISNALNLDVIIKNVYASLKEFEQSIKYVTELRFAQAYNIMNICEKEGEIFQQVPNILGLDIPDKLKYQIEYDKGCIKKSLEKIVELKNKGILTDILVIGKDDNGIEQKFDFRNIIKNIDISLNKNDNDRYNEEVERLILERICGMYVQKT